MSAKKWFFAGMLTLLSLSWAMAAPPAVHPATGEPLVITCLRGTPTAIDGDLSDWNLNAMIPAVLDVEEQLNTGQASWSGPEDLSAEFYLLWDDQNIYMAVIVKDDSLSTTKTGTNIWNADCIEVFFATTNAVAGHDEHYQYGFNAINQKWNWCNMDGAGEVDPDYLQVASSQTADGYICEASIEYARMLSLDFSVGNAIGFHPVLDDTEATDREIQMTWTSREAHDQTLGYGHLILSDERATAPELSSGPSPANGAVSRPIDMTLSWHAGDFAASHDVYFGTVFDDVNDATRDNPMGVLISEGQTTTTYELPTPLAYGRTYYWRVDEVNAPPSSGIFKGEVWSFSTEPLYHPIEGIVATASLPTSAAAGGPQATVDGSGLAAGKHGNDAATMWLGEAAAGDPVWIQYDFDRLYKVYQLHIWNYNALYETYLGFGLKNVTIDYMTDSGQWVTLGDFELSQAAGAAGYAGETIDIGGLAVRAIRITALSNFRSQSRYGLSEVQVLHKPVFAREPQPADAATEVGVDATLSWRVGREAVSHQLYFSTDQDSVADGTAPVQSPPVNSFVPASLDLGTGYYWRVDEVNDAATPSSWSSGVWSFTTQEYISIDDFESYTDEEGDEIFNTWFDGYNIGDNGSLVGHDTPPYAEKTLAHSGQAMPLYYNNIGGVANSQAELAFTPAADWTANGADTLSLYYRGEPTGFAQVADDEILMNGTGTDIWGTTDEFRFVYKQLTGNGSIIARIEYVDYTNEWAKAGVMIRQRLESDSMLVDGIISADGNVGMQWRTGRAVDMSSPDASNTSADGGATFPGWVKLTRTGNVFKVQYSTDGVTWQDIVSDAATDPQTVTVAMTDPVYIGLAVTSHAAGQVAGSHFTGIATTGNVTGAWQSASIGIDQPAGNGIDTFYLAVADSFGHTARFENPLADAVAAGSYQQWIIPLSDITAAGIRADSVKTLYLGVGDPTKPSKNAAGVMYIDDVAFGNPIE